MDAEIYFKPSWCLIRGHCMLIHLSGSVCHTQMILYLTSTLSQWMIGVNLALSVKW